MKQNQIVLLLFTILATTSICLSYQDLEDDYCYGVALEGGGDRGAWQVGALQTLYQHYPQGYQVFSGVSIGAFNSGYLSTFKRQQQKQGIQQLYKIWQNIKQSDFYQSPSLFNIIRNLLSRTGMLNNDPTIHTLHKMMDNRTIEALVSIGATDFNQGQNQVFDLDTVETMDRVIELIKASTSIPGIFQTMEIDGKTYVDGGILQNVDIGSVIRRCRELGYQQKDIIIDVVLCFGGELDIQNGKKYTTFATLKRLFDIESNRIANDDLLHMLWNYNDFKIRHVLKPIDNVADPSSLKFDPSSISKMLDQGKREAQTIIENDRKVDASRQNSNSKWL